VEHRQSPGFPRLAHAGTDINDTRRSLAATAELVRDGLAGGGRRKSVHDHDTRRPKLTVNKVVVPGTDPGKFNLTIDSLTLGAGADVGDGGTTGPVAVSAGNHTVGETAACDDAIRLQRGHQLAIARVTARYAGGR